MQHYGSEAGSADYASKVVTDPAGNVIVVGTSTHNQTGTGSDTLVIKYSGAGMPLWTNRYGGSDLTIGSDGAVYVTSPSDDDFVTAKYVWRTAIAIQLLSILPPKLNLTLSGAPNSS